MDYKDKIDYLRKEQQSLVREAESLLELFIKSGGTQVVYDEYLSCCNEYKNIKSEIKKLQPWWRRWLEMEY